ncbi:coat protein [Fragaria chiloensis latent virus]|uniref:Coat protein n=1 Tax=Fragaria chiloensis latent virus TaxID=255238 RepID=Q5UKX3_9BROM|nr:coat protein [Fragaria chiloensis latent virus]AAV40824.1 coat protein [Fragaria chiloensis latent virus]
MAFCNVCGKQMPCGVVHRRGRPTQRSQNFARRGGMAPRPNTANNLAMPTAVRTEWEINGPNTQVRRFPGLVTVSKGVAIRSTGAGTYWGFAISTAFHNLMGQRVLCDALVMRFISDHSGGVVGVVRGYNPDHPTAPNALTRRRFHKGVATGLQFLAPTNQVVDEIADDIYIVFQFDTAFTANAVLLTRDRYLQHNAVPRVEIPADVLRTEALPVEDIRG